MRLPIARIGVVVPAADEEAHLAVCLAALQRARERVEARGIPVRVVVVLDGCTDRSAEIVAAAPRVEAVTTDVRCVGRARAAGTEHILATDPDHTRLWLANTDADSAVPPGWLETMIEASADLVLGTVLPHPGLDGRLLQRWRELHRATPGHPHVHGANLGVRATALLAAGGWAPLALAEDVDLAARVAALPGALVVRTAGAAVLTSSRMTGRVRDGFAGYLRGLAADVTAEMAADLDAAG